MVLALRSPSGQIYSVNSNVENYTISCSKTNDVAGQWIIFSNSRSCKLLFGVRNGIPLEKIGNHLVFSSSLDEAGEEYIAVLHTGNLLTVKLTLTTQKMGIEDYHDLLIQHRELMGTPPVGKSTVSGDVSTNGRTPHNEEKAFRLMRLSFELLKKCKAIRPELSKHPRGQMGQSGIDAKLTLDAWKRHRSWYQISDNNEKNYIRCGDNLLVEPLRTVPRVSVGGNLFIGAMIRNISDLLVTLPRTTGAQMTAGLLQSTCRSLASLDTTVRVGSSESRDILRSGKLPVRSSELVGILNDISEVAKMGWSADSLAGGNMPYFLPATEIMFQRAAVASFLYALGTPLSDVNSAYLSASKSSGVDIGGEYIAWVDTPSHGLSGWRRDSILPSGYRPDLVVKRKVDSRWLLVDAKLRRGGSRAELLPQSGIKDLQAYMQEYMLNRGVMLVPGGERSGYGFEDVEGEGFRIRSISMPSKTLVENAHEILYMVDEMWC